jgi:hypothetical protein
MSDEDTDSLALRVAIGLDAPLVVERDVLGADRLVSLGAGEAALRLPSVSDDGFVSPAGFERLDSLEQLPFADGAWATVMYGDLASDALIVGVAAVGFELSVVPGELTEENIVGSYLYGGTERVQAWVEGWTSSFSRWAQLLTSQPLDRGSPTPKLLQPAPKMVTWGELGSGCSKLYGGRMSIAMQLEQEETIISERVMDAATFERCCDEASAGGDPPLVLALIGAAKLSAQRGEYRSTLADIGSAAEAVLTAALRLPVGHKRTLGGLVTDAAKAGVAVPTDTDTALVGIRNDVLHRGSPATLQQAQRAIEIVEELTRNLWPDDAPATGLRKAHRPQRMDLNLYT